MRCFLSLVLFARATVAVWQQLPNEPCIGWEATAAAYSQAISQWNEPDCYSFSYTFLGYTIGPPTAVVSEVQYGKALDAGDDEQGGMKTLQDFFDMIQEFCVADCPSSGAHKCVIQYATTTTTTNDESNNIMYPESIYIDVYEMMADEERSYRIENVQATECPAADEDEGNNNVVAPRVKDGICQNYDQVLREWSLSKSQWTELSCYDYTVERLGRILPNYRGPFPVQVRNGVATVLMADEDTGAGLDMTIEEWFDTIEDTCLKGCLVVDTGTEESDAAYKCTIQYNKNDAGYSYPATITFDYSAHIADEELYYAISDVVPCKEPPSSAGDTCRDYEQVQQDWQNAKSLWSEPSCYDYQVERLGRIVPSFRGPFPVQVRDGVANILMADEQTGAGLNQTIAEWFDTIEDTCLKGCAVGSSNTEGHSPAYHCTIEYNETAGYYPSRITFDHSAQIADEESYYALSKIVLCDGSDPSAREPGTEESGKYNNSTTCLDWEANKAKHDAAQKLLNQTSTQKGNCYDFSYMFVGFTVVPPIPVHVKVRDGVAANATGRFRTIQDFMDLIQQECVDECPGEDGAYTCDVQYGEFGNPTFLDIDLDQRAADEELLYEMDYFHLVNCSTGQRIPSGLPEDGGSTPTGAKCTNYQTVKQEWQTAKALWKDPPCYDYTVLRIGEILPKEAGPFDIQVRKGVTADTGGGRVNETINSFFQMIEENCFKGCPDAGVSDSCSIEYDDTDGSPTKIVIDFDERVADEEAWFVISNLAIIDDECGCGKYDSLEAELLAAKEKWAQLGPPACYNITVERFGEIPDEETGPFVVQVVNGTVVDKGGGTVDETISSLHEQIEEECINSCADACTVDFSPDGLPNRIDIDYDETTADEEYSLIVTDLKIIENCIFSTGDTGDVSNKKCVDFQATESNWLAAQETWSKLDPACYDFIVERPMEQVSETEAGIFNVQVRNYTVVSGGDGVAKKTVDGFLDMVREKCLVGCPDGTMQAAHKCSVTYSSDGFPTEIFIDYDENLADEEESFYLSNFTLQDCINSPSAQSDITDRSSSLTSRLFGVALVIPLFVALVA